ncbi:MAG: plasmid pRiA4b ORF-3 family protein [Acetobacter sp.]|nr:plasmid pRiA4b ORF-3 family protein [Bacteroides sp.]MCM1340781.1 plasmid pRiA4b ORF-3 family protein [Acetobacter sp.]MCM1432662.1 plasmid pRiA4b ORF-3 family protein [Clostridiales bacterium]
MATYQFYAELEDYKPKMWRRFLINENMTIAQLGYAVLIIFKANGSHLFNIEKPLSNGNKVFYEISNSSNDDLELNSIERYDATKERVYNVVSLDDKDNILIVNYDFGDDWKIKLKLEEIYGEDNLKNNDIPCVISGKGYGIVEDCGGAPGLMQIAETDDLKLVDLTHFDKNELNDMLSSNMSYLQTLYENEM